MKAWEENAATAIRIAKNIITGEELNRNSVRLVHIVERLDIFASAVLNKKYARYNSIASIHTYEGGMQTIDTEHADGTQGHFDTNGNIKPTNNLMDIEVENYINNYINESKNMNSNKRIITESQLRNIISESVKKVLEEAEVEPSKLAQGYYDVNKITKPDFSVGDEFDTGLSSHPFGHHISYKGQQIGSKLQGGRNLGRDYTFSAPDVDYGNQDGWGRMKWFDRADDYETYVEQNWTRIKELLDTGVDFD